MATGVIELTGSCSRCGCVLSEETLGVGAPASSAPLCEDCSRGWCGFNE